MKPSIASFSALASSLGFRNHPFLESTYHSRKIGERSIARSTPFSIAAWISLLSLMALFPAACRTQNQASKAALMQPANAAQSQARQQEGLKTVTNPGGGEFVFGTLDSNSGKTKADAMRYMLRQIRGHFGGAPKLSKFFQSRDGSSLGVFFSLKNVNFGGGQPMAGLAIIYMPPSGAAQAAVLYDQDKRFSTTEPQMLKLLSSAWRGQGQPSTVRTAALAAAPARIPKLAWRTGGDRSATVLLPEDWQLKVVNGGMIAAEGSRNELLVIGGSFQNIVDPRMSRYAVGPMRSFPGGPRYYNCPLGQDLFAAYVTVFNQNQRYDGKPEATFNLISKMHAPTPGIPELVPAIDATYTVDLHDGLGVRKGIVHLDAQYVQGSPTWVIWTSGHTIPQAYFDLENPLMTAIAKSFTQDLSVMQRETDAFVGEKRREIANIQHQIAQTQAETRDIQSHMMDSHNDLENWQSKITENYILDRSVVRDTDDTIHVHADDRFAQTLVESNPNRWEYVPNMQLVPGVDY
jgi:hypothetical protein